jgi:4-hydroxybenzoyl-CoA reductase subunit beta
LNPFRYLTPESLDSAVRALVQGENVALLAGGTDLIPLLKYGVKKPSCLLNLERVQELKGLTLSGNGIFIGSMVTLSELIESPIVRRHIPALTETATWVASPQIRNQGTVGGNLLQEKRCPYFNQTDFWRANVSPCFQLEGGVCHQVPGSNVCRALYYSDLAPTLLAFDAAAEILDGGGVRTIPLKDLIHDHVSGRMEKVLLKGILIPSPLPGTWGKFMKQSVRSAIDFPLANVAVRYSPAGGKEKTDPVIRIFIGAMAAEPFSLDETARGLSNPRIVEGREDLLEKAMKEANGKVALVRETAVTAKTKRQSLQILRRSIEELLAVLPRS